MQTIHRSAIVPFSNRQMFDLVNDIKSYREFLPWCKDSVEHARSEDEVKASLVLAWGGLEKSFTTHNRMQIDKVIHVKLVEGPFHHLEGFWRFEELDEQACKVILDLEFEFAGKLVSLAFGPVFNQVANSLVESFCQRAKDIYQG